MNMFSSPRVLVIDDEPDAAIPIMRAFASLDIPTAWYTGEGKDVPNKPLDNVRVLILDLVLGTPSFDAKNTAGVVLRSIAPTLRSGPCLFLLWTAHPDMRNEFEEALRKYNEGKKYEERVFPIATACISKADYIHDGQADGKKLLKRIEEELAELAPFNLLFRWEQACAEAAAKTAGQLFALAFRWADNDTKWKERLWHLLDELVKVSVGKKKTDMSSSEYLSALFEPLALIHIDRTRQINASKGEIFWPRMPSGDLEKETVLAGLNHILIAGPAEASDMPGAVLPLAEPGIEGAPFSASKNDKEFRRFLSRVFGFKNYKENKATIFEISIPVVVELTPACDYAQGKRQRLRFANGILCPQEPEDWIEKAAYLNRIGPLMHEGVPIVMVLDSLHFFSLPTGAKLPEPLFRLRSHVRADLQAWLGGHMARPGHLSI